MNRVCETSYRGWQEAQPPNNFAASKPQGSAQSLQRTRGMRQMADRKPPQDFQQTVLTEATLLPLVQQQLQALYPSLQPNSLQFQKLAVEQTQLMLQQLYSDSDITNSMQQLILQDNSNALQTVTPSDATPHQNERTTGSSTDHGNWNDQGSQIFTEFGAESKFCFAESQIKKYLQDAQELPRAQQKVADVSNECLATKGTSGQKYYIHPKSDVKPQRTQQQHHSIGTDSGRELSKYSPSLFKMSNSCSGSDILSEKEKRRKSSTSLPPTENNNYVALTPYLTENWDEERDEFPKCYTGNFRPPDKIFHSSDKAEENTHQTKFSTIPGLSKPLPQCPEKRRKSSTSLPPTENNNYVALTPYLTENWDEERDEFPKCYVGNFRPPDKIFHSSDKAEENTHQTKFSTIPGLSKPLPHCPVAARCTKSKKTTGKKSPESKQQCGPTMTRKESCLQTASNSSQEHWVKIKKSGKSRKKPSNTRKP